jgi:hypothetical protein
MSLKAYANIASNTTDNFTNIKNNDLIIFTESNSQKILFGVNSNVNSSFSINSNICFFNSNIGIGTSNPSELFEVNGGNAKFGSNVYVMSNIGIGLSNPLCALDLYNGVANIWSGTRGAVLNSYMSTGSLTIGDLSKNYGGAATNWTTSTAGLMLECSSNTEICIHDYADRITSAFYYEGSTLNRITLGRNAYNATSVISVPGYLGIGTTSPIYPLHVTTTNTLNYTFGFLSNNGLLSTKTNFTENISARFEQAVSAAECQSFSDSRIKTNILPLSESNFEKLNPVTYNYIDVIGNGSVLQYGLVAQEVQQIFPNIVSTSSNYIPSIYKVSEQISENVITLPEHQLESNDEIILYTNNKCIETKVQVVDQNNFKIEHDISNNTKVFVYGKKIDDFRSISYEKFIPIMIKRTQVMNDAMLNNMKRLDDLELKAL